MGDERLPPRVDDRLTVCYDGTCSVCRATVARLKQVDDRGSLRFVPFQEVAAELPDLATRIAADDLNAALRVVERDGTSTSGGEAVLRIAETVPRLRPIGRLGRLPLIRHLVEPTYRIVARHRHRLDRFFGPTAA